MVIDFHTHIYPDKIASKAVDSISDFYKIPMERKGTAGDLANAGKEGGIGRFVVFSAAAVPGQVRRINEYIASCCKDYPQFTGFGTLHAGLENPEEEIEHILSLGLKGIKLHPDMQEFNIDDERMMKIYALLEGKLPVIFHTGDYRYTYSHPARLAHVLDEYPRLITVAAHFGGWSVFDLALDYLEKRFCYFAVSSAIPFVGKRRSVELIRIYGAQRFLFGSDFPMWDPGKCLEEFRGLGLREEENKLILYRNALDILK
jgi:predicted TIM-barrel fold metal-dependent hydrolase